MRLPQSSYAQLAGFIGDTALNVTSSHALATGRCAVLAEGEAHGWSAVVLVSDYIPHEPFGYGADGEAIVRLLSRVHGWGSVNVELNLVSAVRPALERHFGRGVGLVDDLYFTLERPACVIAHPAVRRLTIDDLDLLVASPRPVQGANRQYARWLLTDGLAVAAFIDGRIASTVHTYCRTPLYAEIGANTLPEHRGRGLASACGALLCKLIQEAGQTPVWSCGSPNTISRRLAEKLGFTLAGKRAYLTPA